MYALTLAMIEVGVGYHKVSTTSSPSTVTRSSLMEPFCFFTSNLGSSANRAATRAATAAFAGQMGQ